MYNVIDRNDTGKGLRITTQLFNEQKAAKYSDYINLPANAAHKAWMKEAETAMACWLFRHVNEKRPWKGYDPALLTTHRDDGRNLRHVDQHACLKEFLALAEIQPMVFCLL